MYRLTKAYIYRDSTVVIDKNTINNATDDDFREVSLILSEEDVKQFYSELEHLREDCLPDESTVYGNDCRDGKCEM